MTISTIKQKRDFQRDFLHRAGVNFTMVKKMMDLLDNVGFYIKDNKDRIVTVNPHNCAISSFPDELTVIGKRSSDLFATPIAAACFARDKQVRKKRKPTTCNVNILPPMPTIFSTFPLFDNRGRVIGTMCAFVSSPCVQQTLNARDRLSPALDRMADTSAAVPTLKELAKITKLSVSHFRKTFFDFFGESPIRYALRLRINKSRISLETTDEKITGIAYTYGFYDQSHFIKTFKSFYKVTPAAYRAQHRTRQNPPLANDQGKTRTSAKLPD